MENIQLKQTRGTGWINGYEYTRPMSSSGIIQADDYNKGTCLIGPIRKTLSSPDREVAVLMSLANTFIEITIYVAKDSLIPMLHCQMNKDKLNYCSSTIYIMASIINLTPYSRWAVLIAITDMLQRAPQTWVFSCTKHWSKYNPGNAHQPAYRCHWPKVLLGQVPPLPDSHRRGFPATRLGPPSRFLGKSREPGW